MNNKITFPELVEQVAQNANTSKRMSELFLKELFATISQSLIDGESVKVKGIGTFKLTEVSARKSVDVNTGEEIEIPGHKKLSFAPDKDLADAVNQPFMHFETEILDDDVTDEQLAAIDAGEFEISGEDEEVEVEMEAETPEEAPGEAAEEASEEVAEETPEVAPEEAPEVVTPPVFVIPQVEPDAAEEEPAVEEELAAEEEPMVEEEPEAVEEPEAEAPAEAEDVAAEEPVAEVEGESEEAEDGEMAGFVSEELADDRVGQEKDKRRITRRSLFEGFVVGVVTTLLVTLFAYRMFLMKGFKSNDKEKTEQVAENNPNDSAKTEATAPKQDLAQNENAEAEQQKAAEEQQLEEQKKAEEEKLKAEEEQKKAEAAKAAAVAAHVGPGSTDTVKLGTNLYKMSRKHYGSDKYWVYIYEENKAKYPNPSAIPVGAVLRIPHLGKYGVTVGDAAGLEAARKKQIEIYNQLSQKK